MEKGFAVRRDCHRHEPAPGGRQARRRQPHPHTQDPEPTTQIAAAEALAQAGRRREVRGGQSAPMLSSDDKGVRRAAVIALGRIPEGAPTIAETMSRMLSTETDIEMRIELATSLGLLGEKSATVIAALTRLMTDPNEDLRRRAVRTLGHLAWPRCPSPVPFSRSPEPKRSRTSEWMRFTPLVPHLALN